MGTEGKAKKDTERTRMEMWRKVSKYDTGRRRWQMGGRRQKKEPHTLGS